MAKTIITIGREYCTGGNYIAEDVANALGIKLYDKELITMAAKHSGLSEEAVPVLAEAKYGVKQTCPL